MSKIVQLVRHLKDVADRYLGAEGELTVDLSNQDLRLHDGTTEGGHVIQSRANADQRYQRQSDELDGFAILEPQQRGIMVRVGPADYRLRRLVGATGSITIQFANGFDGNPTIALAPLISSDHVWEGDHNATGSWVFGAGLQGDLVGNVLGNLTGNVTGNLAGDGVGNFVGTFQGAVDLRNSEFLVDDDQIPLRAVAGIESLIDDRAIPGGLIAMWAGSAETIPAGWAICDGTQGTPNLTDRFIIGAGTALAVGATGGTATHSHPITVAAAGAHTHQCAFDTQTATANPTFTAAMIGVENEQRQEQVVKSATLTETGHGHGILGATDSDGAHLHLASSESVSVVPPYYALAFIMRL